MHILEYFKTAGAFFTRTGADQQDVGTVRTYELSNIQRVGGITDYVELLSSPEGFGQKLTMNGITVCHKYPNSAEWLGAAHYSSKNLGAVRQLSAEFTDEPYFLSPRRYLKGT